MSSFLDLLKEKIIIFDGAMGTYLQSLSLPIEDWGGPNFENCSENLLYTRPDAIEAVHSAFLDVGCDVIFAPGQGRATKSIKTIEGEIRRSERLGDRSGCMEGSPTVALGRKTKGS